MRRLSGSLLAVLVVATVASCTANDLATTPSITPHGFKPLYGKVKATDSLMVLTPTSFADTTPIATRSVPLDSDITVSAVIGSNGGTLTIPAAGLTLTIPKGALTVNTTISITAPQGTALAYQFGPHGTTFAHPVTITQSLSGIIIPSGIAISDVHGAYFDTTLTAVAPPKAGPTPPPAPIKENQLGYYDPKANTVHFNVIHFSGYLVACGRSSISNQ